ncbi:glycoside hydrolase family 32 protein [Myriangium duriaei CBS 260.36]|uniref:Glycoside hydrolase family 32 protein n=1 Tax=Myriangium duriaei CBS 260.36 TaxID=1168546 RepID=A0A9P4MLN2_9PEZI|nr:glycoside hydrolase family 32 protein [Myriangium duriaei CBS 260.36]
MRLFSVFLVGLATVWSVVVAQDLTAAMINTMGNNSLFTRWRPRSHFLAPAGAMSDPCGLMLHPIRESYHLSYLWHPHHVNPGNMSWGHAVSKDLITWADVGGWQDHNAVSMTSGGGNNRTYNGLGAFTGSAKAVNLQGKQDGTIFTLYTGCQFLPNLWYAPYHPGTESQNLATSIDGGLTWQQYEKNPVISSPPSGWNVTAFRDPFMEPNPFLDKLLGQSEPHYYAVFGSGIKGVGPRAPMWSAPASDLTNWTYMGALWEPERNSSFGTIFATGSNGDNFELPGFFNLPDDEGYIHTFVNVGTEGGNVSFHPSIHWSLWYEGTLSRRTNGSVAFDPISGGPIDHGALYALTSFNDTKHNRRILIGWAPEDPSGAFAAVQQGFQGCMCVPRELFVHTVRDVVNHDGHIAEHGPISLTQNAKGTFTARTLGVRPAPDIVSGLRKDSFHLEFPTAHLNQSRMLQVTGSTNFELMATMDNPTGPCGFRVGVSPDNREYTTIFFNPSNYSVVVNRASSSLIQEFSQEAVTAYFRPYYILAANGDATMESLNWHIYLDGSLLEVYVNDRFGIGLFVGDGARVHLRDTHVWANLRNVWPERPLNSSSYLVYDSPEDTNNYTWWSGT